MRYAKIRKMDISNGSGVGISLFVQGCHFHCKGCFNQETWNFKGGKPWTPQIEEQFIELANKPYIKRISILGGEPLADENVETVYNLIIKLKNLYPDKQIWLYTGYTWEDIRYLSPRSFSNLPDIYRLALPTFVDVVVDGQFQLDKQDLHNESIVFAGSTNQRIIDSVASVREGKVILYKKE